MPERDFSIDVLRFIALTGLIIIHIDPSILWIREIRSFDVPMMVFLSGVSYMLSSGKSMSYWSYVKKRFERLIIPTWVFLVVYYAFITVVTYILFGKFEKNTHVLLSFAFYTTWYVWVIRIFFIIALLAPWLVKYCSNRSLSQNFLLIVVLLVINELIARWVLKYYASNHWTSMLIMNVPYIVFFIIGTLISRLSKKQLLSLAAVSLICYLFCASLLIRSMGEYVSLQDYKYPPQFYYISYGFMSVSVLWLLRIKIVNLLNRLKLLTACVFVGQHTIWCYFWHIFFVWIVVGRISSSFIRFLIVFLGAILMVYLQHLLLNIVLPSIKDEYLKKKIQVIFNG